MNVGSVGGAIGMGSALVLGLMICAYPFYRIISLWIDKALTASEALLYLSTLGLLLMGLISTWGTPLGWLVLAALLFTCCGIPLLNQLADRLTLRRLEDEDIAKYQAMLARYPASTYAYERLARLYLGRKLYAEALAQVKEALHYEPDNRGLKQLAERVETALRRQQTGARLCPKCSTETPPEVSVCLKCGYYFVDPADFLRGLWTPAAVQASRFGGMGAIVLALLLALLGARPGPSLALFAAGILSLFWSLYVTLRR